MDIQDPTDTLARERMDAKRKEDASLAATREADDIRWLMGSMQGRRIVWGLLQRTGIFRSSFTGNSETFFREGARNIGLQYLAAVNEHCPEQYNLMVLEQKQ